LTCTVGFDKGNEVYRRFLKRLLDIVLSACALAVLLPFLVIIAALVRFKLGSPVIFRQDRPGKDGRIFTLHKFRTMTDKKDDKGEYLPDAVRLTKFGKFLRAASLDELPELWNILKGDMSIVGPRPLLIQYLPFYSEEQKRRHQVRPGLTGWAQVKGRNAISWEEKFNYDVFYVDNVKFLFDLKIIWLTFINVIRRKDINNSQSATMPFFTGS
jgi:lipopolysaccharide/colanic/teichoic acid biosynthesis glycosyltransferase